MSGRVAIIGSREASPALLAKVREYVMALPLGTVVVTGAWWTSKRDTGQAMDPTRGVDAMAARAANDARLVVVLVAGSDRLGRMAGMARNPTIIDIGDRVVAFWDGVSPGTKNGLDYCRTTGKKLSVIRE